MVPSILLGETVKWRSGAMREGTGVVVAVAFQQPNAGEVQYGSVLLVQLPEGKLVEVWATDATVASRPGVG
jgi:hypothetical protein